MEDCYLEEDAAKGVDIRCLGRFDIVLPDDFGGSVLDSIAHSARCIPTYTIENFGISEIRQSGFTLEYQDISL